MAGPGHFQDEKISQLEQLGFTKDKLLSDIYDSVVYRKYDSIWVFFRDGLIEHNPQRRILVLSEKSDDELQSIGKPIVVERFADNGEHSHWELIKIEDSSILWSEDITDVEKIMNTGYVL